VRWRQKLGRSVCICVYPRAIIFSDAIRNVDTKFGSGATTLASQQLRKLSRPVGKAIDSTDRGRLRELLCPLLDDLEVAVKPISS